MRLSRSVVHATLPPQAERLFLGFEPMTSMSQVSKQPYFWSKAHPRNKMLQTHLHKISKVKKVWC